MNKILFKEEQQFRQWWWIVLILGATIPAMVMCIYALYQQTVRGIQVGDSPCTQWRADYSICLSMRNALGDITNLNLKSGLIRMEFITGFFPLIFRNKLIAKEEIQRYEIRKYSPIIDYGGWGVRRGFGRKWQKAFNVSGNIGLQLYLTNGKKVLFGTQRSQAILYAMDEMMKLKSETRKY